LPSLITKLLKPKNMNIILTLRSILRGLKSNIISIIGMSLAFAVAVFISIYVYNQVSFDKSQSNYDSIYRLELGTWASLTGGVIPWVAEQFPEVESYARIGGTYWESTLEYEKKYHTIDNVMFMDGEPFSVFDFNMIFGDDATALEAPNAIILTESVAKRIFNEQNPVGRVINYNRDFPMIVTAVIEDPDDIHLNFQVIINFRQLAGIMFDGNERYMSEIIGSQNYMGYFVLNSNNADELAEKIKSGLVEMNLYSENNPPPYSFRPFSDIYFADDLRPELGVIHGNKQIVIALIFVALFVLIIATINYINVSTAEGISRTKEVGLKKILGSNRLSLFTQFILESTVLCFVSMIFAVLIILILYQWFQSTLGLDLPAMAGLPAWLYIIFLGMFIVVSVTGGLYPALYLSSLKPGSLLKTSLRSGGRGLIVRRILILAQFIIAIFLTTQSIGIFKQYMYMKNSDPGVDIDQIIQFELPDYLAERSDAIREALKEYPDIEEITFSGQPLGSVRSTRTFTSPRNQEDIPFRLQIIDPEHIQVLGLEMLSGTFFSRDMGSERYLSVVINETGARAMGYDPPETITDLKWRPDGTDEYTFIGVVKDYHFNSLEVPIQPSLLVWMDGQMKASLRFKSNNIPGVISHIEEVWKSFEPDKPLNYRFLEETFNSHYTGEQRLGRLISIFTIIAVIIACFGVYGISAFMARKMSKNISLRKVLGADTVTVVEHFTTEYFWLIIIASVISIPLGYLYINHWLGRFPYQTDVSVWIFVVAFLLNLVVTISTILYHAFKTATLDPVTVLRYE